MSAGSIPLGVRCMNLPPAGGRRVILPLEVILPPARGEPPQHRSVDARKGLSGQPTETPPASQPSVERIRSAKAPSGRLQPARMSIGDFQLEAAATAQQLGG